MSYAIVDAPGHYSIYANVYEGADTIDDAARRKYAMEGTAVLATEAEPGDKIHSTDASRYGNSARAVAAARVEELRAQRAKIQASGELSAKEERHIKRINQLIYCLECI